LALVVGGSIAWAGRAALAATLDGSPPDAPDGGAAVDGGRDGASADAGRDGGARDGAGSEAGWGEAPAPVSVGPRAHVRGVVLARGGHRHVSGATISIDGAPAGETDAAGRFDVEVSPGPHSLAASSPGLVPVVLGIVVAAGGWSGTLRLAPGTAAYETVVAAKQPAAAVRVAGEEARTTPGTAGDPYRVIESLPGVSQIVWPFALYAIRGANPGNTGFFLDGMRVPALYHFALGPSIVHPYLVDKLTFYPGGYPARLGGYVSGAVVSETAAPPSEIVRLAADVRVYDVGGLATSGWDGGRGTVAVAARYSYTGLLVSHLFSNVKFGYADYNLRIDHALWGGQATLMTLGSFDSLDIATATLTNADPRGNPVGDASLQFHRIDLRWQRAVGPGRFLARTTFALDDASSQLFDSPIAVRAYTIGPRIDYLYRFAGGNSVEVGADSEVQRFRTDVVMTPSTPPLGDLARSRGALTSGVYASAAVGWGRLSVDPGLRYAFYAEQGVTRGVFEPRLAARFALGPGTSLDATLGRFSQMPSLPLSVAGFEGFGLADFGPQTSTQAAGGFDGRLPAGFSLRLTGFYQWLLVSDLRSTFARDPRDSGFLEMRAGRGYGGELLLRAPEGGRVRGWIAYTLSWSLRDFDGIYGPSDWDQRHILNVVATTKLGPGWTAGARFHYNTGRPYPVETTFGTVDYFRLPAFWQLDLRADRRIVLDRATLDVYFELGNATFTPEVVALQRQLDSGPPTDVGFRIVLPSIGVHAEW
jgi:hypothetical protein